MKKQSLKSKVSKINRLIKEIDEKIAYNEKMYRFFVKLSLDYNTAFQRADYTPFYAKANVKYQVSAEVDNIYMFAQKYLQKRAFYIHWMLKVQSIIRNNNLGLFILNPKYNNKSYFDDLI